MVGGHTQPCDARRYQQLEGLISLWTQRHEPYLADQTQVAVGRLRLENLCAAVSRAIVDANNLLL